MIPEASLAGSWTFGPKWSLVGFARASHLGDGIVASPIVGKRTTWPQLFQGAVSSPAR